jgi:cephalosporin hydroxylase
MERVRAQGFFMMRPPLYADGLNDLINYVNTIRPTSEMKILEIGSYIGESTMQFAKSFKEVVSIDPFIDDYDMDDPACHCWPFTMVYERFLHNTMPYSNIKSIRLKSDEAVGILSNYEWDMLYIDGLHTYDGVMADIKNYKPLIKKGGFIAGHDYIDNAFGVKKAVDENFTINQTFKDTSWIVRI